MIVFAQELLFTLIVVLLVHGVSRADSYIRPMLPETIVSKFLELNGDVSIKKWGIIRTKQLRAKLQRLVDYHLDLEEYATTVDVRYLYRNFKILEKEIAKDKAIVAIEYQLIATTQNIFLFQPHFRVLKEDIELIKKKGQWHIKTRPCDCLPWQTMVRNLKSERKQVIARSEQYQTSSKYLSTLNTLIRQITTLGEQLSPKPILSALDIDTVIMLLFYDIDNTLRLSDEGTRLKKYLRKQSPKELKILRNAIFARKNYNFETLWIEEYFRKNFFYYRPKNNKVVLTDIDKENIQYLLKIEKEVARKKIESSDSN